MARSRAATQAIIEKDTGYLVTVMRGTIGVPIAASRNVKDAYGFAKTVGQISEMSASYKTTIRTLKKDLFIRLWDKSKHDDCPLYDYVDIRPIKLI